MLLKQIKFLISTLLLTLFCFNCFAQIQTDLFAEVAEDEKLVAECEQERREFQLAQYGRILPKISGHCWDGCPMSIVLPIYPSEAKQLRISGQVIVETIVDENGYVVYAKSVKGKPFLNQNAENAAYRSRYQPKKTCNDKPIKFRWTITYNFILEK